MRFAFVDIRVATAPGEQVSKYVMSCRRMDRTYASLRVRVMRVPEIVNAVVWMYTNYGSSIVPFVIRGTQPPVYLADVWNSPPIISDIWSISGRLSTIFQMHGVYS
jgi:hypothetical protein